MVLGGEVPTPAGSVWKEQVPALGVQLGSGWRQHPAALLTAGFCLPLSPGKVLTTGRVSASSPCSGRSQPARCSFLLLSCRFLPSLSKLAPSVCALRCLPPGRGLVPCCALLPWLRRPFAPQSPRSSRAACCDFQSSGVYFPFHVSDPRLSGSPDCSVTGPCWPVTVH